MKKVDLLREKIKNHADSLGNMVVEVFHYIGLFIISAVIFWASSKEIYSIFINNDASIDRVLLLFIYLELWAMVGIYFKTNHLPIRFLLYIGITAMTRHLIGIITDHNEDTSTLIHYCIGILLLAISVLSVRYASYKFPSSKDDTNLK